MCTATLWTYSFGSALCVGTSGEVPSGNVLGGPAHSRAEVFHIVSNVPKLTAGIRLPHSGPKTAYLWRSALKEPLGRILQGLAHSRAETVTMSAICTQQESGSALCGWGQLTSEEVPSGYFLIQGPAQNRSEQNRESHKVYRVLKHTVGIRLISFSPLNLSLSLCFCLSLPFTHH